MKYLVFVTVIVKYIFKFNIGFKILYWSDSKVEGGTSSAALSFAPDCSPRYSLADITDTR